MSLSGIGRALLGGIKRLPSFSRILDLVPLAGGRGGGKGIRGEGPGMPSLLKLM